MYVLKMFGCLLYIYNTKKACFFRLSGVHMHPIHLDAPHIFGCPCMFGDPHMFGCPSCPWMPKYIQWHQNIQGEPNMEGIQPYRGVFKHRGHPNIWESANMEVSKHPGRHPNMGCPNILGASIHTGGVQRYGASKHTGGHPNIW